MEGESCVVPPAGSAAGGAAGADGRVTSSLPPRRVSFASCSAHWVKGLHWAKRARCGDAMNHRGEVVVKACLGCFPQVAHKSLWISGLGPPDLEADSDGLIDRDGAPRHQSSNHLNQWDFWRIFEELAFLSPSSCDPALPRKTAPNRDHLEHPRTGGTTMDLCGESPDKGGQAEVLGAPPSG